MMMRQSLHILITLGAVAAAVAAGVWVWNYYLYSAWTRDGRIRAEIVTVVADVSGRVSEVNNHNAVERGEVLFRIDAARYRTAVARAKAVLAHNKQVWERAELKVRQLHKQRDAQPDDNPELTAARLDSERAKAEYQQAKAELASQQINLRRTTVTAPADGWLINPGLLEGSYVHKGAAVLSVVQKDSFYATGYFDETKLPLIRVGQKAEIRLMAGGPTLTGRVTGIARAIANANAAADSQLLPQIQPAFSWVRLAQRIPVDIALDPIPTGVRLSAGMTATIILNEQSGNNGNSSEKAQPSNGNSS